MGLLNYNSAIKGTLACKECHTHYLLELLTNEKDILLRKYCFCGESTSQINNNMKLKFMKDLNFFTDNKCKCIYKSELDIIDKRNTISKYCNDCKTYLCKDCINKHEHKNLIDPNLFLINCKYHQEQKLVGFCRKCIKPLCQKCVNDFHRNHDIRYAKQLNKFIIEKYQDNLLKAISEYNKLIKIKYSQNMEVTISNLSSTQKNLPLIDFEDKQIIISLEILKTMLDLYTYHNNNGSLNYQLITNILKHINFEVIRLPDKGSISGDDLSKNKYSNFNNTGCTYINDKSNKNLVIHLQIDLNDEEKRIKKMTILSSKDFTFSEEAVKVIILKNGDLVFSCDFEIQILKDLKDISSIETEGQVEDFIQLENENLVVLSSEEKNTRKFDNTLEIFDVKNDYKLIKKISLKSFGSNKEYSKIIIIDNYNFGLLSYSVKNKKIYITYINNKDYKEIKLLELNSKVGNFIYNNGYIIITTARQKRKLKKLDIHFYNFLNKLLELIFILDMESAFSFDYPIDIFAFKNETILISTHLYGLIINVKSKQIESKIENFKNISCLENLNGYLLAGFKNGIISQINLDSLEISNNFITNSDKEGFNREIVSIVNIGNNQFCALLYNDRFYQFIYK